MKCECEKKVRWCDIFPYQTKFTDILPKVQLWPTVLHLSFFFIFIHAAISFLVCMLSLFSEEEVYSPREKELVIITGYI